MDLKVDDVLLKKCLQNATGHGAGAGTPSSEITIERYELEQDAALPDTSFTSNVGRLRVQYLRGNESKTKSFIVKIPHCWKGTDEGVFDSLYTNEAYMYERVLPGIHELLDSAVAPAHYLTTDSRILLLEDLSQSGFAVEDRRVLGFAQSAAALRTLAKYHAASYKLNLRRPNPIPATTSCPLFQNERSLRLPNVCVPVFAELLRKNGVCARAVDKFESYEKDLSRTPFWEVNGGGGGFQVLNHGDLKATNVMLNASGSGGKCTSAKLIDFQTVWWGSPATDLIYFFASALEFSTFEKHGDDLLRTYLDAVNATLLELRCDVRYTEEQFYDDSRRLTLFRIFSLIFCAFFTLSAPLRTFFQEDISCATMDDVVERIRNDRQFNDYFLSWFKYYEKIGIV